jgi:CRP/FNR family transcriptional regulator, cyclic AMP receptor protein
MRSPYGFDIIESCTSCKLRKDRMFCNLPDSAIELMQSIKATAVYPKGALLCLEGQPARGVFILCNGHAKISTSSADGKTVILRIAGPGEVLGLSSTLSGKPHDFTVETMEPTQANFIGRADFLKFLAAHPAIGMKVADQLTHNCQCAYEEIRSLGLSRSVAEKVARLILLWSENPSMVRKNKQGKPQFKVTLTQEEISQMIGSSRETVSRVLSEFKKERVLEIKGCDWIIVDKSSLERHAQAVC